MSVGTFDLAIGTVAVVLTALAVKDLDDFVDAGRADDHRPVYAAMLLAMAGLVAARFALPFFVAAWCVGMRHDLTRRLPSGLTGLWESILGLTACALLAGPIATVTAVAAVTGGQLLDDVLDAARDRQAGRLNWAHRLEPLPAACFGLALLAVASFLDVARAMAFLVGLATVWLSDGTWLTLWRGRGAA